ncbi:hypothetical protein BDZ85DRAFT_134788 [Elsinoe ampelina]|uniref:Uncharacterized protein n=1 Tax=Elsinoe ampelina TaxID=302913 RepID=A0A6A6G833_9PEZI|nr:hypothetical protein BDZ85DRAFT_134788 [Elsinoe ampelina]
MSAQRPSMRTSLQELDFDELCDIWEHADLLFRNESFDAALNIYHDCATQTSNAPLRAVLLLNAGIAALHSGRIGQAQQLWLTASTCDSDQVLPHFLHGVTAFHQQQYEEAQLAFRDCRRRFKPGRLVMKHRDMGLDFDLMLDHVLKNEQIAAHELFQHIMGRSTNENRIDLPHDFPGDLIFQAPTRSPSSKRSTTPSEILSTRGRQTGSVPRRLIPPRLISEPAISSPATVTTTSQATRSRHGHGRSSSALPSMFRSNINYQSSSAKFGPMQHFFRRQFSRIRPMSVQQSPYPSPFASEATLESKLHAAQQTRPVRPPRPDEAVGNSALPQAVREENTAISPAASGSWSILDLYMDRDGPTGPQHEKRRMDSRIRRWQSSLPDPREVSMERYSPFQEEMTQIRPFQRVFISSQEEETSAVAKH